MHVDYLSDSQKYNSLQYIRAKQIIITFTLKAQSGTTYSASSASPVYQNSTTKSTTITFTLGAEGNSISSISSTNTTTNNSQSKSTITAYGAINIFGFAKATISSITVTILDYYDTAIMTWYYK